MKGFQMKKLVLIALAAVLALSSCGKGENGVKPSNKIEGTWMRMGDSFQGTVVKIENGKGKILMLNSDAAENWNKGDYKFKGIKKDKAGVYSLGDLYTGKEYKDSEAKVNGLTMTISSLSNSKVKYTYIRIPENYSDTYKGAFDGDTMTISLLPYDLIGYEDGYDMIVQASVHVGDMYYVSDDGSYISIRKDKDKLVMYSEGDSLVLKK